MLINNIFSQDTTCVTNAPQLRPYDNFNPVVPSSVDFRELGLITRAYDQGQCGACEMFVAAQMAESVILRDFPLYYLNTDFGNSTRNISISVDFLLRNSVTNQQCNGGNYYLLMNDMIKMRTFETSAHFPYDDKRSKYAQMPPKIRESNFIQPFKLTQYTEGTKILNCPTNIVIIKQFDQNVFNQQQVNLIKHTLAKGIPVKGSMLVDQSKNKDKVAFNMYKSGVLHGGCSPMQVDHAIMYVGYGKYKGKDVWALRNSWGDKWGQDGIFYVEIGKNSFCTEMEAITSVPASETSETIVDNNYYKQQIWNYDVYRTERGRGGFDFDNGTYFSQPVLPGYFFSLMIECLFGLWLFAMIMQCVIRKINNRHKVTCEEEPLL
ncbi:Cathepsin_L [Hexamita inflata]|uniref:Cathepsin_L n=1 Tax=Hexamita inflata TaxID=28002 RepID=A0ABP1H0H7_9EUKA